MMRDLRASVQQFFSRHVMHRGPGDYRIGLYAEQQKRKETIPIKHTKEIMLDPKLEASHYDQLLAAAGKLRARGQTIRNIEYRGLTPQRDGLETILYHGITLSPSHRTIVRTYKGGRKEQKTERLNS